MKRKGECRLYRMGEANVKILSRAGRGRRWHDHMLKRLLRNSSLLWYSMHTHTHTHTHIQSSVAKKKAVSKKRLTAEGLTCRERG